MLTPLILDHFCYIFSQVVNDPSLKIQHNTDFFKKMFEQNDKFKLKTEDKNHMEMEQCESWPFNGFTRLTAVIQNYTSRRVFFFTAVGYLPVSYVILGWIEEQKNNFVKQQTNRTKQTT